MVTDFFRFSDVKKLLTPRCSDAHKGDFGHVLIIGGDHGMAGAVSLAGFAALRSGAGMVSIATRAEHISAIVAAHPEIMAHAIHSAKDLTPLLARASVIALGPGLGQSDWSRDLFSVAMQSKLPMVVDADALTLLAEHPQQQQNWILTPHPGEAARLLGLVNARAIQADRIQAMKNLQQRYGGVIVLKGAGTLVSNGEHIARATGGNPGMATAGMGDVLTGITAGFVAQGYALFAAAKLAVAMHAEAGDRVALFQGERGMVASDIIKILPQVVNA